MKSIKGYALYITTDRFSGGVTSDLIEFETRAEADYAYKELKCHSDGSSVILTRVTKLYPPQDR